MEIDPFKFNDDWNQYEDPEEKVDSAAEIVDLQTPGRLPIFQEISEEETLKRMMMAGRFSHVPYDLPVRQVKRHGDRPEPPEILAGLMKRPSAFLK